MSVNLSGFQLQDDHFFTELTQLAQRHPFNPGEIVLEVKESIIMQSSMVTLARLKKIADLGFHLAIDDFGTSYSSLHYLNTLPIKTLKIDEAFIKGLPLEPGNLAVCEAIIHMAEALKMSVIAEGVETPEQMQWLHRKGVLCAQGYFYTKALPAEDFAPFLGVRHS